MEQSQPRRKNGSLSFSFFFSLLVFALFTWLLRVISKLHAWLIMLQVYQNIGLRDKERYKRELTEYKEKMKLRQTSEVGRPQNLIGTRLWRRKNGLENFYNLLTFTCILLWIMVHWTVVYRTIVFFFSKEKTSVYCQSETLSFRLIN